VLLLTLPKVGRKRAKIIAELRRVFPADTPHLLNDWVGQLG